MKTGYCKIGYLDVFCLLLAIFVIALPDPLLAAGVNTPMGNTLCTVTGWFTGNTGKGLATLGVIILGVGALLGKISWGAAIIHGVGGAIIMGAAAIVGTMGAGATGC